jgi:coproporphyrinogen III oxidase-like Fe-S oxidoreductase
MSEVRVPIGVDRTQVEQQRAVLDPADDRRLPLPQAVEQGGGAAAVDSREELTPERKVRETAYLALRTSRGLDPARFERDTGVDPRAFFAAELARLGELGLVTRRGERLVLTGRGVSLADAVARELL